MTKAKTNELIFDFSDPRLFVPVYLPLLADTNRLKIIYGSRGSAKSFFAAQKKVIRCLSLPYFKCLMVRKMRSDVGASVYQTVKDVIKAWRLEPYFRFYESRHKIVCKLNGNSFLALGLNEVGGKSGTAKSIPNPTDAIIEEGDEITEVEYTRLALSLRGSEDLEEILLFNPPDEDHWIIKRFFPDKEDFELEDGSHTYIKSTKPEVTILHTTYLMNPFCTDSEKAKHEEERLANPEAFRSSGLGLLITPKTGGEALPAFDRKFVTKDWKFDPTRRILEVWDFNKRPFHTVGLYQFGFDPDLDAFVVDLFKEYCLPDKSVREVQRQINKDLKEWNYQSRKIRFACDYSGRSGTDHDAEAFAAKIHSVIRSGGFDVIDESRPNPAVVPSLDFLNDIFAGRIRLDDRSNFAGKRIQIRIFQECKFFITDFEKTKTDKDGKLLKVKKTETLTDSGIKFRVSYEARGHAVDNGRYMATAVFEDEFAEYIRKE